MVIMECFCRTINTGTVYATEDRAVDWTQMTSALIELALLEELGIKKILTHF